MAALNVRRHNIIAKYGKKIERDLEILLRGEATLQKFGDKHGFSRENARMLFQSFYGIPYSATKISRMLYRNKERRLKNEADRV